MRLSYSSIFVAMLGSIFVSCGDIQMDASEIAVQGTNVPIRFASDSLNSYVVEVASIAVSEDGEDCSRTVKIYENEKHVTIDLTTDPGVEAENPGNGTYNCVVFEMKNRVIYTGTRGVGGCDGTEQTYAPFDDVPEGALRKVYFSTSGRTDPEVDDSVPPGRYMNSIHVDTPNQGIHVDLPGQGVADGSTEGFTVNFQLDLMDLDESTDCTLTKPEFVVLQGLKKIE